MAAQNEKSKADFELLENVDEVDDGDEALDHKEDFEAEPVKRDEVAALIQELGFGKIRQEEREPEPPRRVKLVVAPLTGDETPELSPSEPLQNKKVKKTRNKYKPLESGTTTKSSLATSPEDLLATYTSRGYLLCKPGGKWMDQEFANDPTVYELPSPTIISKLKTFAAEVYEDEVALYTKQQGKHSNSALNWRKTVLSSGTLSDKMAALTLKIQDSHIHNLSGVDTLVAMVSSKGRREALIALDTLRDLFLSELIPDRKLKTFQQHPLADITELASGNRESRDKRLILWYFEGELKDRYDRYIKAIEVISHDTVAASKQKALATVFELLANKPEQEKVLLSMMVNKLGDPEYKTASKAVHQLNRLVDRHANMKGVVVLEVERLLYRPNISVKAQYYAICFLNQLQLSHQMADLAARLITIYFSFFKVFVKKGEVDSKMLSALLSGVNRAYPFAKAEKVKISDQLNTLYKTVHVVSFNVSVQTLMLLYQVMGTRYVYFNVSVQTLMLLYQVMGTRYVYFNVSVQTLMLLYQVMGTRYVYFNVSVQTLMLLYQVMGTSDNISDRYYVALYRKLGDPELKHSARQSMFLNLLFKSMKKDVCERRVSAFIKRLLQVCSYQPPPFICAALILLSELLKTRRNMLKVYHQAEDIDDDEEERFVDVKDEDAEEAVSEVETSVDKASSAQGHMTAPSWVHRRNLGDKSLTGAYDPLHRNPLYCNADHECVLELRKLTQHYHPSVALFAQSLLKGERVTYSGDPLQDFTLIHFLNRFVYRNPKKSVKEPSSSDVLSHKKLIPKGVRGIPVNDEKYLEMGEKSIPVDEKFFYRYFVQKATKTKKKEDTDDGDIDSDAESISDAEFDGFLDDYETQIDGTEVVKFDFAGEFTKQKAAKSKKGTVEEEEDELIEGLSDEEMGFSDDEDFKDAFVDEDDDDDDEEVDFDEDDDDDDEVDFDEEGVAFSDDSEDLGEADITTKKKKGKRSHDFDDDIFLGSASNDKKQKTRRDGGSDLFAAAEEFSHLIDENTGSKFDMIGSGAVSNKDNAHVKQLMWEEQRDKWLHDKDWRSMKKATTGYKGHKKPNKPSWKFKSNKPKQKKRHK
ncbi:CCAAT/enhancer-binding protein zeta [Lamellibrachia satsuma]|nr:CCAAT/enhancer-binding protein zeta [Lamellibrachia satsuma]